MINLLPIEDKILIRKEYVRRLLAVIGFFLFGFICIAVILLFPSYFLLVSQEKSLENRLAIVRRQLKLENANKIEISTRDLNNKLFSLNGQENASLKLSILIGRILENKPPTVKLIGFSYQRDQEGKERLLLQGSSFTRPPFLLFLKNLETIKGAAKVISPASNILKEENIIFNLVIEMAHDGPTAEKQ